MHEEIPDANIELRQSCCFGRIAGLTSAPPIRPILPVAKVLYLTHRIPYPPDKGDKIATWHILRHLAGRHEVYLGSFVDDPDDWQHEAKMRGICADVLLQPIHPKLRRLRSFSAVLTGESISAVYYRDRQMRQWVDRTVREQGIRHAVLCSSPVVQYVAGEMGQGMRRVAHFSDVDSEKWRQYGTARRGPVGWVYRREADRPLEFEAEMAGAAAATAFVTDADAELFRKLAPQVADRVGEIENGVDTAHFDPSVPSETPHAPGGPVIVFTVNRLTGPTRQLRDRPVQWRQGACDGQSDRPGAQ